jgi:hypothetical protein
LQHHQFGSNFDGFTLKSLRAAPLIDQKIASGFSATIVKLQSNRRLAPKRPGSSVSKMPALNLVGP